MKCEVCRERSAMTSFSIRAGRTTITQCNECAQLLRNYMDELAGQVLDARDHP